MKKRSSSNADSPAKFRPPSIKDIAKLAKVSHPTVSRALKSSPLVHPRTAEKIRKIALESGYRPSAIARGLLTRKTRNIGLVVTSIADPFTSEVASGFEQAANDLGYCVILGDSNADPVRERKIVEAFAERRLDGIVVTSSRVGALYRTVLDEMRVPIVLVNNQQPGSFTHSVTIRNQTASRVAVDHLIAQGHKRIAYIGDRLGYFSDTERLAGYRDALKHAGIRYQPELVTPGDGRPEAAQSAMDQLLNLPELPTAVFCYNDMSALGAMRAIRQHGLRIPTDISIVGFDDLFLASYTDPPLTTMRQPMRKMGQLAMQYLVRLIDGEKSEVRVEVDAELMIRASTGPPSTSSKP